VKTEKVQVAAHIWGFHIDTCEHYSILGCDAI